MKIRGFKWALSFLLFLVFFPGRAQKLFSVDYESQADLKLFVVEYESQADLKIFFVDYPGQAGWRNKKKMPLLY